MALPVWSGVNFGPLGQRIRRILDKLSEGCGGLYITSALRNEPGSYHGGYAGGAAVDVGFGYGSNGDKARARCLAAKLYAYSGDLQELIVTDVGSNNSMGGYYVKNGSRVPAYAANDHRNHIHVAMIPAQVARWEARLFSNPSPPSPPPPSQPSTPSSGRTVDTPWYDRPEINRGDTGEAVGHLQFLLRDRLGYDIDRVAGNPFGPQTEAAVKDFQSKYATHVSRRGVVGPKTWAALEVKAARAISLGGRPELSRGDSGGWVGYVQHCLRKAGYRVDDVVGFPFGPQTEAAVVAVQNKYAPTISRKGTVGSMTYEVLDKLESGENPSTPPPSSPKPPPTTPTTVQRGDEGPVVCQLQQRLRAHGYSIDRFDHCPFGPQTEAAVRDFQSKNGLTVNGIVASSTWQKLDETPSNPPPSPPPSNGPPTTPPGTTNRAPRSLEWLSTEVRNNASSSGLGGVSFCGIGPASANAYGYHNSRHRHESGQTTRGRTDYSVQLAADRTGDPYLFSAIDLCGSAATKVMTQRMIAAVNRKDPRLKYVREFYGTTNGTVVTGRSHNSETGAWRSVSSDDSHLFHIHISFFRKYAGDPAAAVAVRDVLLGR